MASMHCTKKTAVKLPREILLEIFRSLSLTPTAASLAAKDWQAQVKGLLKAELANPCVWRPSESPESMLESSYMMSLRLTSSADSTIYDALEHHIWCFRGPAFPPKRRRKNALPERRGSHDGSKGPRDISTHPLVR